MQSETNKQNSFTLFKTKFIEIYFKKNKTPLKSHSTVMMQMFPSRNQYSFN